MVDYGILGKADKLSDIKVKSSTSVTDIKSQVAKATGGTNVWSSTKTSTPISLLPPASTGIGIGISDSIPQSSLDSIMTNAIAQGVITQPTTFGNQLYSDVTNAKSAISENTSGLSSWFSGATSGITIAALGVGAILLIALLKK